MDKTGAESLGARIRAPNGLYHTIVIDPPWNFGNKTGRHGAALEWTIIRHQHELCVFAVKREAAAPAP